MCWRWILIRQWNQLNLLQHLLFPPPPPCRFPSFSASFACSCKAIIRNYIFMFAWVLMDEKLFIITIFSWVRDAVVAGGNERKLITCVSYQVKLIINYTWWRGRFAYWFFFELLFIGSNFNFTVKWICHARFCAPSRGSHWHLIDWGKIRWR